MCQIALKYHISKPPDFLINKDINKIESFDHIFYIDKSNVLYSLILEELLLQNDILEKLNNRLDIFTSNITIKYVSCIILECSTII